MSKKKGNKHKRIDRLDIQKGMIQGFISWISRRVIELLTS